jgi:hypothetical protein
MDDAARLLSALCPSDLKGPNYFSIPLGTVESFWAMLWRQIAEDFHDAVKNAHAKRDFAGIWENVQSA